VKKINISQVDTLFVNGSYPIEFLLFYEYKINTKTIRKALKRISSSFWPLFGIYNDGKIQSSKYSEEKFYNELKYNEDFNPTTDEMQILRKYCRVNPIQMEGLFFLSILQFKNGTVIIPRMNHLVGDGYSYFYFLSVLATLSFSSYIPFKEYAIRRLASPKLNRTVLKAYHFNKTDIKEPFEHQNCTLRIEKVQKTYVKDEIKKIKSIDNISVSTNDILSAMVFKKSFEKQKERIDNRFTLSIPIDVRRQVNELGPKFFGNGIMIHHLKLNVDDLEEVAHPELALKLRRSIPAINTESYLEYLSKLESEMEQSSIHSLSPYDPEKGCLITNLSRMPVQKLNFGSGTPVLIFPLTMGKNSTAILADKDNFLLRLMY
jgi:hypothetical protein